MSPIVVTMLGVKGSGKTTYLYAMFGRMSRGVHSFGLYDRNRDNELELLEGWDALLQGAMPPATDENPRFHDLVLQHGRFAAAELSWADFRGGALLSRSDGHDDVIQLRSRLSDSDSVHLVFDGGTLAEVAPPDLPRLSSQLGAERMSTFLGEMVDERVRQGTPLPSVVVLITKADRIAYAAEDAVVPRERRLAEVVEAVIGLLPVLRRARLTFAVCPVQVGWFGDATDRVDPSRVQTQLLDQPILFTAMHHHFLQEQRLGAVLGELDTTIDNQEKELAALGSRLFAGGRRRTLRDTLAGTRTRHEQAFAAYRTAQYWRAVLDGGMDTAVPLFHDGQQVRGVRRD